MVKKDIKELLEFGVINIDKPSGPTSFSVGQYVMKSLGLRKTSHMGTLDPGVSGVLPIMFNRACKLSDYFMKKDKTYVGIMRIHEDISQKKLEEEMKKFTGKITQLPPVRSKVRRAEREREVKSFEIIEKKEKEVLFLADVEAGTYIRKLCSDLGEVIGGAHMLELRRTKAGIFDENNSVSLYEFDKAVEKYKKGDDSELKKIIFPVDEIIKKIVPVFQVKKNANLKNILTGKPLTPQEVEGIEDVDNFALFKGDKFIGVYRTVKEGNIIARPDFVRN